MNPLTERLHSVKLVKTSAIIIGVLAVMYFGKILFVPLFFAVLISFILYPICKWMENKGIPRSAAITIGMLGVTLPLAGLGYILVVQVMDIMHSWPLIRQKLDQLPWLTEWLRQNNSAGPQDNGQSGWLNNFLFKNSSEVFSGIVGSLASLVQLVMIPIYAAIILYQRHRLVDFIQQLFPEAEAGRVKSILQETVITYYNFVKGMAIVYLVVGILNSIGLALLGIPHAMVYGFAASVMTFIPYIGIMIASVMPMVTAWAMHDSIYYPLGVVGVFAFVQFLEANLIFPLAVSSRIKINMLFTLMAIFLGGIIWGTSGMILFIPFVGIIKLIADKTEKYKAVGQLLGGDENGKANKIKKP